MDKESLAEAIYRFQPQQLKWEEQLPEVKAKYLEVVNLFLLELVVQGFEVVRGKSWMPRIVRKGRIKEYQLLIECQKQLALKDDMYLKSKGEYHYLAAQKSNEIKTLVAVIFGLISVIIGLFSWILSN